MFINFILRFLSVQTFGMHIGALQMYDVDDDDDDDVNSRLLHRVSEKKEPEYFSSYLQQTWHNLNDFCCADAPINA